MLLSEDGVTSDPGGAPGRLFRSSVADSYPGEKSMCSCHVNFLLINSNHDACRRIWRLWGDSPMDPMMMMVVRILFKDLSSTILLGVLINLATLHERILKELLEGSDKR